LPIRFDLVPFTFSESVMPTVFQVLYLGVQINLLLAVFNMMPIPPLDGFTILVGLLPAELAYKLEPMRRYGTFLLLALILFPTFLGFNILGTIIGPFRQFLLPFMIGSG
jgi:Zn-dependent protease